MIYIISYEPAVSNMPNIRLRTRIQQYYGWKILGKHTFLIATKNLRSTLSIRDIKQELSRCCLYGDKLFIAELGEQASWIGMDEEILTWLKYYSQSHGRINARNEFIGLSNQRNNLFHSNIFENFNNQRNIDMYRNKLSHMEDEIEKIGNNYRQSN